MKIVFATNNKNKLEEIREILGKEHEILSLSDIGCNDDIEETGLTLEENAAIKAKYIYDKYNISVFADDTGLEVEALNGAPGVFSARYAGGVGHDSEANMKKLLHELEEKNNRKARFRTVIAFIRKPNTNEINTDKANKANANNANEINANKANKANADNNEAQPIFFEGIVDGSITKEKRGDSGFGYDPIFMPDGYNKTFAELGHEIKNNISHRARAVKKFVSYLSNSEKQG